MNPHKDKDKDRVVVCENALGRKTETPSAPTLSFSRRKQIPAEHVAKREKREVNRVSGEPTGIIREGWPPSLPSQTGNEHNEPPGDKQAHHTPVINVAISKSAKPQSTSNFRVGSQFA